MSRKHKPSIAGLRSLLDQIGESDDPPPPVNLSPRDAAMFVSLVEQDADDHRITDDPPDICHGHGKRKFTTRGEAKRVIRSRQKHGAGRLRVYHCPECHRFHISSSFHQQTE